METHIGQNHIFVVNDVQVVNHYNSESQNDILSKIRICQCKIYFSIFGGGDLT